MYDMCTKISQNINAFVTFKTTRWQFTLPILDYRIMVANIYKLKC